MNAAHRRTMRGGLLTALQYCPTDLPELEIWLSGACPGKVDTGFSDKDMRKNTILERIPIPSDRHAL
jgi:hypothetical protein